MKALAALLLMTATAAAEDFALLDQQGETKLDLAVDYLIIRGVGQLTRFDPYAAVRFGSFGIYGKVAAVYENDQGGNSDTGLSGLELGGFFHAQGFTLRIGMLLPTGTDGVSDNEAPVVSTATSRLGDFALALPGTTALRLGASYEHRQCAIFYRFDVGLDAMIDYQESEALGDEHVHLNAGIGFDAGDLEVTAESLNEFSFDGKADPFYEVAGSLRFRASQDAALYLALGVPLNDIRGQPMWSATVGVTVR